jgi:ABC-2 type transport system permease protein
VVAAKGTVVAVVCAIIATWAYVLGLGVGAVVDIPGWSAALAVTTAKTCVVVVVANVGLQSVTALVASAGRGYLAPVGFTFLVIAIGNILGVLGHGTWFPWAIPMLYAGAAGPQGESVTAWSFVLVALTALLGAAATLAWWERADQAG